MSESHEGIDRRTLMRLGAGGLVVAAAWNFRRAWSYRTGRTRAWTQTGKRIGPVSGDAPSSGAERAPRCER